MEGDLALLPEIVATAKEFGARIMVDDAHGIGVLGETGRGTLEHFGVADDVDLVMGTFSKSFASLGGFIAGSSDVISYIRYHSNALMQATAMPPFLAAAAKAALEVIQTEPEIRASLWDNTKFLLNSIRELGFDTGPTCTPIVPLIVGDDFRTLVLWKRLFDEGLFTNCVLAPAVPEGQQRIRTCLMATHTREDLEKVVEICGRIGRGMELIP
jgi:7-keto-8-aminopelargonate synthetase-like enzyme